MRCRQAYSFRGNPEETLLLGGARPLQEDYVM